MPLSKALCCRLNHQTDNSLLAAQSFDIYILPEHGRNKRDGVETCGSDEHKFLGISVGPVDGISGRASYGIGRLDHQTAVDVG